MLPLPARRCSMAWATSSTLPSPPHTIHTSNFSRSSAMIISYLYRQHHLIHINGYKVGRSSLTSDLRGCFLSRHTPHPQLRRDARRCAAKRKNCVNIKRHFWCVLHTRVGCVSGVKVRHAHDHLFHTMAAFLRPLLGFTSTWENVNAGASRREWKWKMWEGVYKRTLERGERRRHDSLRISGTQVQSQSVVVKLGVGWRTRKQ